MEWLGSNWIWLALGAGIIVFFAFGRGGRGMRHGSHEHGQQGAIDGEHAGHAGAPAQAAAPRHRHGCC